MASTIDQTMVNVFSSNVYHLSQQKDARIWPLFTRSEKINAEEAYFDRIGGTEAMEKVGRNSDTTYVDVKYDRRRLTMRDYFWATLVDRADKLRIIHSPESEQAIEARKAMARKMDDIAVAALLGTVYTGKRGATPVNLPDSQKLLAVEYDTGTSANVLSNLNIDTLLAVKQKFDEEEVDEDARYIVCPSAQISALLREDKLTSSDFAAVKALVRGEVNEFMGFKFIRTERIPVTTATITNASLSDGNVGSPGTDTINAGARRCIAFTASALIKGVGEDVTARVSEMPGKHYSNQVYFSMTLGAMRMEEVKVIEILTK